MTNLPAMKRPPLALATGVRCNAGMNTISLNRNCSIAVLALALCMCGSASAGTVTWDGRHSTEQIEVTVVYFVPSDRRSLVDWRDRVDYFCGRIEQFHAREFHGQSTLMTRVVEEPMMSESTTAQLRNGDADFIFFQTLGEADRRLEFGTRSDEEFPILLVLSDINWRPLDDFYRLHPGETGLEFEGQFIDGQHFPGATSGGARATYLADRGVGWGLVSADGWRVPYRGTDCVVYHEGCGHTVGLPHPEPGDASVMSLGQYNGWISESWLDNNQKATLGWSPPDETVDLSGDLFTHFRALPQPAVPMPGEEVSLTFDWPADAIVESLRVRMQTSLDAPWQEVAVEASDTPVAAISLGSFDRPTPVSYRIEVELADGQSTELWGYFQVRSERNTPPLPSVSGVDLVPTDASNAAGVSQPPDISREVDLLALIDVERDAVAGEWTLADRILTSPKQYGARIEIPFTPEGPYRMTVICEPLDAPNALNLGQMSAGNRFVSLVNYTPSGVGQSALENIDGNNVGNNPTTVSADLFQKNRLSQVVCEVREDGVRVIVDGVTIIDWQGDPARLSLSDYWNTPNAVLFLGAYDCRYRFYRVTLQPLE